MDKTAPMTDDPVALARELRERKKRILPPNWKEGRNCPNCESSATRQKCMWEIPDCPRHNPDNYSPSPWQEIPDPLCARAATYLETLSAPAEDEEKVCREIYRAAIKAVEAEKEIIASTYDYETAAISAMREYARRLRASHPVGVTDEGVTRACESLFGANWHRHMDLVSMRYAIERALSPTTNPTTEDEALGRSMK